MREFISSAYILLRRKQIYIVTVLSAALISIWTILRHITNGINFDVVGQVGVADQWIHGIHGGVELGSTHYLLKMPIYMFMNLFGFIEPKTRLLLLALAFNIAAILLIYWLGRKILTLYAIKNLALLNLGILWLSLISGRVFWTDYANSRNLEVAGGIAILYLVLKLWKCWSTKTAVLLVILASIVFFSDPLQMYVLGVGSLFYGVINIIFKNAQLQQLWQNKLKACGIIIAAAVISKFITISAVKIFPIAFLDAPKNSMPLTLATLMNALKNISEATLRIFDINIFTKAFSVNSLRQMGGLVILSFIVFIIIHYRKQVRQPNPVFFFIFLILWNYLVYIASGNVLKPLTERYIILVPVLLALIFAFYVPTISKKFIKRGILFSYSIVLVSGLLLIGAIFTNWGNRFALDKPMFATASFAKNSSYDFIVTSRGLAIPGNYYAGYSRTIIPVICAENTHITASNLFYDQGSYHDQLGKTRGRVALLLPAEGIVSDPFSCSREVILTQFGEPIRQFELENVGTVYEYPATNKALKRL